MPSGFSVLEFEKALLTLNEALQFAQSVQTNEVQFKIARDACIQRFEYCIELSWKVAMKKLGSVTKAAKPAVREMARSDLITSAEKWLKYIDAGNDSIHSYDEDVARRVFLSIQEFSLEAKELLGRLKKIS